jgi:hypothetical protein
MMNGLLAQLLGYMGYGALSQPLPSFGNEWMLEAMRQYEMPQRPQKRFPNEIIGVRG